MKDTFQNSFKIIKELVSQFESNFEYYKSAKYQEAEVRKDFIDKFFEALGWDVDHKAQKNPYKQEVKIEKSQTQKGEKGKKFADYAFYLEPDFKNPVFFTEAKKPAVTLANNKDYYLQTHKYGWNSKVPISILTDFEELIIIDCRTKPDPRYSENTAVKRYYYKDYLKEDIFKEIFYLFSREAVSDNSIDNFVETQIPQSKQRIRQLKLFGGDKTVDDDFLDYIDDLRVDLANAFYEKNSKLTSEELTEATQKTIDRLVFTRFLEDKQIEYDALIGSLKKWKDFISLSNQLNGKYNGVVYKPCIIDRPEFRGMDDGKFVDICLDISSNESPYNFNAIPIHILGNIYERFLGNIVVINNGKALIEPKPEVRKAGGVFYTPKYIVDYLVEKTIGGIIKGKTPKEIDEMSFADISCGSGSFLIGAYEKLIDYHKEYYHNKLTGKDKLDKRSEYYGSVEFKEGVWEITLKRKQEILLKSIFGVDIDSQAVEVTQLSLFLKLLEDESLSTANRQQILFTKVLPDLSDNIQCGNSLVGWDVIDFFPDDDEKSINPFNFRTAFPQVFKNNNDGFDAIIGNPPYVKEYTDREAFTYVKQSYLKQYFQGKMDLWYFFVCNSIDLLKQDGLLGYIAPNNWTTNAGASIMRNKIIKEAQIIEMIDFGSYMIFKDASIQTMNLLLKKNVKKPSYQLLYSKLVNHNKQVDDAISLLKQDKNSNNAILTPTLKRSDFLNSYILFDEKNQETLLKKIQAKGNFIFDPQKEVAQGIVPNPDVIGTRNIGKLGVENIRKNNIQIGDGVFVVKRNYFKNLTKKESSFLKPLYEPYLCEKYFLGQYDKQIIYTTVENSISPNETTLYNHLKKYKNIMEDRRENVNGARTFYQLHWGRDIDFFSKGAKIISVRKCDTPTFIYTEDEAFVMMSFNVIKSNRINLKYLTGILNSALIKFWLKHKGKMQGDNFQVDKDPLLEIPIYLSPNKEKVNELSDLVEDIIKVKKQFSEAITSSNKDFYKRKIKDLNIRIDKVVYDLYGITSQEEIRTIEEN